jgi:hypothetical protein
MAVCAAIWLGGCAQVAKRAGPATGIVAKPLGSGVRAPFPYTSLGVRNSCFVESVHFYDQYLGWKRGGAQSWARILQWGHQDGDYKIAMGHAVAVFTAQQQVWIYDVNFGFVPLKVPLERHADITDVAPEVFTRYPQFKPVFARYREDFFQRPPGKIPEHLFYHANPEVRDATKVAAELGRYRPVGVVEFEYPADGRMQNGAATVFVFGNRLCTYFPSRGTHITRAALSRPDDLRAVTFVVQQVVKGATNVRWQPGGYWFYPPKT